MTNKHIVSILRPIAEQVEIKRKDNVSLLEIKKYIIGEIGEHRQMNSSDAQTMIREVSLSPTTTTLTRYLWNALLKFEGLSVLK